VHGVKKAILNISLQLDNAKKLFRVFIYRKNLNRFSLLKITGFDDKILLNGKRWKPLVLLVISP
jgi:hypothetical protein